MTLHSTIHDGKEKVTGTATSKRVLIVTAVDAECDAVLRGLQGIPGIDVIAAGVGIAAAAARTAAALAPSASEYRLVISAGIGGGFAGQAEIGSLVVADLIVAADLGAETPDGFLSLDELGFGSARITASEAWNNRLFDAIHSAGLTVCIGPILTVTTATGTAATTAALAARVNGAAAEGMEGHGVAVAAAGFGIPVTEIRAISNAVGPRDRAAWRIGEALASLEEASKAIREVLS
ncbi:futalosine hydrolase [Paenibacillus sp. LHD-38]|uniref:futalosine hydrolase n=1 Tax=Paenibacillus sp. LHD-38 TaxID=3072143 RepID=UPI0028104AF8|nr:futalosine hydrolase [Paenibacillus sp. LHD-38]MDQ8736921.1 futalosine hydrolase [Paenibacillus sp. LHD-38]